MNELSIEDIKARLDQLKIFELRHTARAIGVERPTAYKRAALLVKILAITSGTDTPVPCESTVGTLFADEQLVKDILAYRKNKIGE